MLVLVAAVTLFLFLFLTSLFLTYYVTILLNEKNVATLDSIIMLQIQMLSGYILEAITGTVSAVSEKLLDLSANITVSFKKVVQLLFLSLILLTISGNLDEILDIMDQTWRCVVYPFFQNFTMGVAQGTRLIYDTLIPLYNYYYVVASQATRGTIAIALKCDFDSVVESLRLLLQVFINIFQSVNTWSGMSKNITVTNNIFVNELNVTEVVDASQSFVAHQEKLLSCICSGLEPAFDIAFELFKDENFPKLVSHGVNALLSYGQTFVGILPFFAQFPDFKNTTYHTNAFFFYGGRYMDKTSQRIILKSVQLFDDEFHLEGVPDEFIFQSLSHFFMGFTHTVHTFARTIAHIVIPLPYYITDSNHMMKSLQFNEAFQEFHLGLRMLSNNAYWLLEVADKLMKEVVDENFEVTGIAEHTELVCSDSRTMKWSANTVCAVNVLAEAFLNVAYIATNMFSEILWKSFLNQEQNILVTLQRYDGPSYGTNNMVDCEYRKTLTHDLTQGRCICLPPPSDTYFRPEYTVDFPFGVPRFDPYCEQPNLQANVFGNVERAVIFGSSAGFDALVGDFLATNVLIINNLIRSGLKFLLNIPYILEGEFFENKVNCGYGVSEKTLEEFWLETRDIIPCSPAKSGFMKNYVDGHYTGCVPIHETIRFSLCHDTKNKDSDLCTEENKAGCTCNIALPLEDDSLCECIALFPDREQQVAQGAFENTVLKTLYQKEQHFCNTFLLEPVYFQMDRYAFILDRFLSQFHPSFDTQESKYCEINSYSMIDTNVIHYTMDEYSSAAGLFDALSVEYSSESCKLYGSYDVICSASMSIRSAVRLIISQVRQITMQLFLAMTGDFSHIEIDLSTRLCDLQRIAAGLSSFISDILNAFASNTMKTAAARVIFSLLNGPVVILDMINTIVQFFVGVAKQEINLSTQQPVFDLIMKEMKIVIDYLKMVNTAMEGYFDLMSSVAGDFFRSLNEIILILEDFLNDGVIEMLNLLFKTAMNLISMLTSGTVPNLDGFFNDLWTIITKFVQILLQNAGKLIDTLLDMLGPIGSFIKGFASDVCMTIQDVLCTLTMGETCDLACAGGEASSFSPPPIVQDTVDAVGDFFSGIFGRRLHSSLHNFPSLIADLRWTGTSECDLLVNALRDTNFTELAVFERAKLMTCVDERILAVKLAKEMNLDLPSDLFYNWKRKWLMIKDFVLSGMIIFQNDEKDIFYMLKQQRINPKLYSKVWRILRRSVREFFHLKNIDQMIHHTFQGMTNSSLADVYKIYNHTSRAVKRIGKLKNMHTQAKTVAHFVRVNVSYLMPFTNIHQNLKKIRLRSITPQSASKKKIQKFILKAAGVQTNMDCTDGAVCLNCLVVENLITTTIDEGKRMAGYYTNTYPVVVQSFRNYFSEEAEAQKAWRTDMAKLLQDAAARAAREVEDTVSDAAESVGKFSEEQIKSIERGYKLKHTLKLTNTSFISVWKRATKDWEYLWKNWEIRNSVSVIDVLRQFLTTTDDTFIPFFGHSLSWFITYPFTGTCSMEVIYCTQNTVQTRMERITDAFYYLLYFTLAIFLFRYITELPLPAFILPYILYVYGFIYVLTVYNWIYPCFPNVPNCLLDDLTAWVNENIPDCWCSYFPGLSKNCDIEVCHLCSLRTEFYSCSTVPHVDDAGIFWAALFYLRKNYPQEFVYMYDTLPFSWVFRRFEVIKYLAQQIKESHPLKTIETDCYTLKRGDIVLTLLIVYVSFEILSLAVPLTITLTSKALKIVTMILAILYNMALSLEFNSGVDFVNTYQNL